MSETILSQLDLSWDYPNKQAYLLDNLQSHEFDFVKVY